MLFFFSLSALIKKKKGHFPRTNDAIIMQLVHKIIKERKNALRPSVDLNWVSVAVSRFIYLQNTPMTPQHLERRV